MRTITAASMVLAVAGFGQVGGGPGLTLVVMDPLARPLACACVAGHAQRDYDRLAAFLSRRLERPVRVIYGENLERAALQSPTAPWDLIIGKASEVHAQTQARKLAVFPLARLSGKDGQTTLTGLFVVKAGDQAQTVSDLRGRRFFLGPVESEEKHAAALSALRQAGVDVPKKSEVYSSCQEAVLAMLDSTEQPAPVAVISSYALALLEGCGTVDKGVLRVVGRTAPRPFITVFAGRHLDEECISRLREALAAVRFAPGLLAALESKEGFMEADEDRHRWAEVLGWPGWRGPWRNGCIPYLPSRLPTVARVRWKYPVAPGGLAGLAAAEGVVVVAGRDSLDQQDHFVCLQADTGTVLWELKYATEGNLDYGNSPRATPLIVEGKVYLLGAFGDLHCVNLADGRVIWRVHLIRDLGATLPKWGACASPLWADGKFIVSPGGKSATLAALEPKTGQVIWRGAGGPAAYASPVVGTIQGRRQVVAYDVTSLGGWDLQTGKRLWTLTPAKAGDYNVPTPVIWDQKVLVATENNGTRLHAFNARGIIQSQPAAAFADLAPDVVSPLVVNGRVFGFCGDLYCLSLRQGLRVIWKKSEDGWEDYASLISDGRRLLVVTYHGELFLLDAEAGEYRLISRLPVLNPSAEVYSHPALVGHRLFLRGPEAVWSLELEEPNPGEKAPGF